MGLWVFIHDCEVGWIFEAELRSFECSMCRLGIRRLLLLSFLLSHFVAILGEDGFTNSPNGEDESIGVVRVEGGPPGVVWVVQVSDIHISKWKPERGRTLRRALGHALKLIKPAIVLISGDLTGLLFCLVNCIVFVV